MKFYLNFFVFAIAIRHAFIYFKFLKKIVACIQIENSEGREYILSKIIFVASRHSSQRHIAQ
jgi:hypothetical protein